MAALIKEITMMAVCLLLLDTPLLPGTSAFTFRTRPIPGATHCQLEGEVFPEGTIYFPRQNGANPCTRCECESQGALSCVGCGVAFLAPDNPDRCYLQKDSSKDYPDCCGHHYICPSDKGLYSLQNYLEFKRTGGSAVDVEGTDFDQQQNDFIFK